MVFLIAQCIGWSAFGATMLLLWRQYARRDPRWGYHRDWPKLFVLLGIFGVAGLLVFVAHFFRWDAHPGGDFLGTMLWPGFNVIAFFFFLALTRTIQNKHIS
jgi:hypothetical protein